MIKRLGCEGRRALAGAPSSATARMRVACVQPQAAPPPDSLASCFPCCLPPPPPQGDARYYRPQVAHGAGAVCAPPRSQAARRRRTAIPSPCEYVLGGSGVCGRRLRRMGAKASAAAPGELQRPSGGSCAPTLTSVYIPVTRAHTQLNTPVLLERHGPHQRRGLQAGAALPRPPAWRVQGIRVQVRAGTVCWRACARGLQPAAW